MIVSSILLQPYLYQRIVSAIHHSMNPHEKKHAPYRTGRAGLLETGNEEFTVGRDEFLSTLNIIRVNNSKGVADSCQSADCVKLGYTEFIELCGGNRA